MGVHVTDAKDDGRYIRKNWWHWRAIVEAIRSLRSFDEARLNILSDGHGNFSADECQQVSTQLEAQVLARLKMSERMLLNGSTTDVPDDFKFYREEHEVEKNYSVTYDSLLEFIEFCRQSKNGVIVG